MKNLKAIISLMAIAAFTAFPLASRADNSTNPPLKVYPLKTCLVCDMELGMMGKPYVFVYQGQEIKVCNQSEKADFDKDPAKYLKKLAPPKTVKN